MRQQLISSSHILIIFRILNFCVLEFNYFPSRQKPSYGVAFAIVNGSLITFFGAGVLVPCQSAMTFFIFSFPFYITALNEK